MDEAYMWIAHYSETESLPECGATPEQDHAWAEVDQRRLFAIELYPLMPGHPALVVKIPPEAEGVFFRRRSIELDPVTEQEITRQTITVVGWRGWAGTLYLWIYPDGSLRATSEDDG